MRLQKGLDCWVYLVLPLAAAPYTPLVSLFLSPSHSLFFPVFSPHTLMPLPPLSGLLMKAELSSLSAAAAVCRAALAAAGRPHTAARNVPRSRLGASRGGSGFKGGQS